jgi:hypothetical protein
MDAYFVNDMDSFFCFSNIQHESIAHISFNNFDFKEDESQSKRLRNLIQYMYFSVAGGHLITASNKQ